MDPETLLAQELAERAKLNAAKADYAAASLKIRMAVGAQIRALREAHQIKREELAALIGIGRQSLFTCEEPEAARKSFTVERLLEVLALTKQAVEIHPTLPRVTKKPHAKPTLDTALIESQPETLNH